MAYTQAREVEDGRNVFPLLFLAPLPPVLLSLYFSRHRNTFFLSFLPGSLSCFFLSASRIDTCRIHAYLYNCVFNFTGEPRSRCEGSRNERDSARTENQTLEKEIQVLKEKSEDHQRENQAPQKNLESVKEEQGHLQQFPLSENLEAAKKEQEKIRQLQRENNELKEKVTKKTSEFEKLLAREQQIKKLKDSLEKCQAETKAKDVSLKNMRVENKRLREKSNAERSKCDALSEEVRRLREMPGRKCFVQFLPYCRPRHPL